MLLVTTLAIEQATAHVAAVVQLLSVQADGNRSIDTDLNVETARLSPSGFFCRVTRNEIRQRRVLLTGPTSDRNKALLGCAERHRRCCWHDWNDASKASWINTHKEEAS